MNLLPSHPDDPPIYRATLARYQPPHRPSPIEHPSPAPAWAQDTAVIRRVATALKNPREAA